MIVLLDLLFEICLFKSYYHVLKISKALLPFALLLSVWRTKCESASRPAVKCLPRLPASPLGDSLNAGGLRWRSPRKGACPGEKQLCRRGKGLLVLALLRWDSNTVCLPLVRFKALFKISQYPTPKECLMC